MKFAVKRVSIRVMLAFITVFAVGFAYEARRWQGRKSIVQAIRQNNGIANDDLAGPDWLRALVGDDDLFRVVREIDFGHGFADFDPKTSDAQIIAALAPMPRRTTLEFLGLGGTSISDRSLEPIGRLRVDKLALDHTKVTDDGMPHLSRMTSLRMLSLDDTSVTDDGVRRLTGLVRLEELELANTSISDAAMKHLRKLPNLSILKLDGTSITDDGLMQLTGCDQLSVLVIRNTRVTASGFEALRTALPRCKIVSDH